MAFANILRFYNLILSNCITATQSQSVKGYVEADIFQGKYQAKKTARNQKGEKQILIYVSSSWYSPIVQRCRQIRKRMEKFNK